MARAFAVILISMVVAPVRAQVLDETRTTIELTSICTEVGTIANGEQTGERTLMFDTSEQTNLVVLSEVPLAVELVSPSGERYSAGSPGQALFSVFEAETLPAIPIPGLGVGHHTFVQLPNPEPGHYRLEVDAGSPVPEDTPFVITVLPLSEVRMALRSPQPQVPLGTPWVVAALVFEGSAPVNQALVTASVIRAPDDPNREVVAEFTLLDDGAEADLDVADGIYSGVYTATEPGDYAAVARATGQTASGSDFVRDAATRFTVTEPTASLTEIYLNAAGDVDGSGLFDMMRFATWIDVTEAATYDLTVILGVEGGKTTSHSSSAFLETGRKIFHVDFPANKMRSLEADGPYILERLVLRRSFDEGNRMQDRASPGVPLGRSYNRDEFEAGMIELLGASNPNVNDENGDGQFDSLEMDVQLQIEHAGDYSWTASLADRNGTEVVQVSGVANFEAGAATISLSLDGCSIGASHTHGPYRVLQLVVSGEDGLLVTTLEEPVIELSSRNFTCNLCSQSIEEDSPCDNCPGISNPEQMDGDGDLIGDMCDNCLEDENPQQADSDLDGIGNLCDRCPNDPNNDSDGDNICGDADPCPNDPGNDPDGDGICSADDTCPGIPNDQFADQDGDGVGDGCDPCTDFDNSQGCQAFMCYRVRLPNDLDAHTSLEPVHLNDAFQDARFDIDHAYRLCLPASVNGAPASPGARTYLSYRVDRGHGEPDPVGEDGLSVQNVFGSLTFNTRDFAAELHVPTNMGTPGVSAPEGLDAYRCRDIHAAEGFPDEVEARVADAFEDRVYRVNHAERFCSPAAINQGPLDLSLHPLICHDVHRASGEGSHQDVAGIYTNNRFGALELETWLEPDELCVPATVALGPVVIPPPGVQTSATSPLMAADLEPGRALDYEDGALTAVAHPPGPFAIGTHTITWSATDSDGNTRSATQRLEVLPSVDVDGDGIADLMDNCPSVPNVDQLDDDADGLGNACDPCPDGPQEGTICALSSKQQACINTMHKGLDSVTSAVESRAYSCLRDFSRGRLNGPVANCLPGDPTGQIQRARTKLDRDESRRCEKDRPPFGATYAATIEAAARRHYPSLLSQVFAKGGSLETGLIPRSPDRDANKCQLSLFKRIGDCYETRLETFTKCAASDMRSGAITSPAELAACVQRDDRLRIHKACNAQDSRVAKDLADCLEDRALPSSVVAGCETDDVTQAASCIERITACSACLAIREADALGQVLNCDALDDSVHNGSCFLSQP